MSREFWRAGLSLNIKARHDIPEFLTANLSSIHVIAFDIDWKRNIFSSHNLFAQYCWMLIKQLINLRKVRTENLKFRTESDRSSKSNGCLVSYTSNIAFHLRPIWLQTLVAIDSDSCQTSFPIFYAPPSEVAVLFNSILSRHPFFGQIVYLDLQLCSGFDSEHDDLFVCPIYTQRSMSDRKNERSSFCDLVGLNIYRICKRNTCQNKALQRKHIGISIHPKQTRNNNFCTSSIYQNVWWFRTHFAFAQYSLK